MLVFAAWLCRAPRQDAARPGPAVFGLVPVILACASLFGAVALNDKKPAFVGRAFEFLDAGAGFEPAAFRL